VRQVRKMNPGTTVEILPSDMKGDYENLNLLMGSEPDIFNHNIETVRRLTKRVRAIAKYDRSLELLQRVKNIAPNTDRKSTRLNSSHVSISYAVFCLKKKINRTH